MFAQRKPLKHVTKPLTRLKRLWHSSDFSDTDRDYWRAQLSSGRSKAALLTELNERYQLQLPSVYQITLFRAWVADQDELYSQAARYEANVEQFTAAHPDWTLDQVREEVMRCAYLESITRGNWKLGLDTIKQDLATKKTSLDTRRVELLEKKAAALEAVQQVMDASLTPEQQRERLKEILK